MKIFVVDVSVNSWEHVLQIKIKATDVVKTNKNKILADGVELTFDEEVDEPMEEVEDPAMEEYKRFRESI